VGVRKGWDLDPLLVGVNKCAAVTRIAGCGEPWRQDGPRMLVLAANANGLYDMNAASGKGKRLLHNL
jgi:hypothetical protein